MKLAAHGIKGTAMKYIYSCFENCRQCVRLNDTYSDLEDIISGVPEGLIVSSILFIALLNDFYHALNTFLYIISQTITLIIICKDFFRANKNSYIKGNNENNLFSEDKMKVNSLTFKSFVVPKKLILNQPTPFMIGNNKIDIKSSMKLLLAIN